MQSPANHASGTSACREFLIRAEVMSPLEIIRSATLVGAEVVRQEGQLGEVAAGALADLLVIDGDPLDDLGLFQDEGAHIPDAVTGRMLSALLVPPLLGG